MKTDGKLVQIWLLMMIAIILAMVLVGGVTRLTDSGLSMVEWKPILGAVPPVSEIQWLEKFELYKQYPEYQKINKGMSLTEFKFIFFWEYFHRLLGRLVGLLFFIPWAFFLWRKMISPSLAKKSFIGFLLGGAQGVLGWYMVMSGLVDRPDVSHYRLAAHLCLAVFLFGYFVWLYLETTIDKVKISKDSLKPLIGIAKVLPILIFIQIIYGAFVAGLKAGYSYNTFPLMNGSIIPTTSLALSPMWLNLFDNTGMVQFIHRSIAFLIVGTVVLLVIKVFSNTKNLELRLAASTLALITTVQFSLGVATLLLVVPLGLASAHQVVGVLLFGASLWVNQRILKAA